MSPELSNSLPRFPDVLDADTASCPVHLHAAVHVRDFHVAGAVHLHVDVGAHPVDFDVAGTVAQALPACPMRKSPELSVRSMRRDSLEPQVAGAVLQGQGLEILEYRVAAGIDGVDRQIRGRVMPGSMLA
jgi:hypothetical protein